MAHYDHFIVLDVASAPLPDAETYLEGTVRAPGNYKDAEKIAAYVAEKQSERLQMAATDIDLARITGIGMQIASAPIVTLCREEADERQALTMLADVLRSYRNITIITFNGFAFDLPLLMRRARYLDVPFPTLNLDRYRSPHRDLCEELCDRNPQRRRSLGFYAKRLNMGLTKALDGAEEARVPETGQWAELEASLIHDITATRRLADWLGIWPLANEEAVA